MPEAEGSVYGTKNLHVVPRKSFQGRIQLCRNAEMCKCVPFAYRPKPDSIAKRHFTAVGVSVLNGFNNTTVFIKGSHFGSTASFSRAQKFVRSRQMAPEQLLLQMTP